MDEERIDFTALDPLRSPERKQALSEAIVAAHWARARTTPFSALLAGLGWRAVLTAALFTLLTWLLPGLSVLREPPAPVESASAVVHWMERGHPPTGMELLRIAEVGHGN